LYNQASILFGKPLGSIEILDFKTLGFTQLDFIVHIKNRLRPASILFGKARLMVIAVECKTKSLLLENQRLARR